MFKVTDYVVFRPTFPKGFFFLIPLMFDNIFLSPVSTVALVLIHKEEEGSPSVEEVAKSDNCGSQTGVNSERRGPDGGHWGAVQTREHMSFLKMAASLSSR